MSIHQPHDKLFKRMLGLKAVAIDFLKAYLSKEELQYLDLSSLKLQKNSFLDSNLQAHYSDVIHKVDGVNGEGYLYFLLEHQSTSDLFIVEKLLRYFANIIKFDLERQLESNEKRRRVKMPAIYPFVVYSGKEAYRWPEPSIRGKNALTSGACVITLLNCANIRWKGL